MRDALFNITDWFIPYEARWDRLKLGRARNFVFTHIFGPALGQFIVVFLAFADPAPGLPFWTIAACIWSFWTLPFLLKFTGNQALAAFLSVETLIFVTLFGAYHYGGVSSPFLPWLLVSLLLGFFYFGERPLIVLGTFALNVLGFMVVYLIQGGFPQIVPLKSLSGVGMISVISATIYMGWMAIYYGNLVSSQSELEIEAERHRATAARLQTAKEGAERASLEKSIFLAKMSHELRTPLNAVIGYSEILLEEAVLNAEPEEVVADLKRINAAGQHLLSLVNDVLDLSSIESNDVHLNVVSFDLGDLIQEVASTCRPLVAANGNELIISNTENLGSVSTDATKLRQCIINLLSNAAKFTKDGLVVVSVRRDRKGGADWIELEVRDTGIGIHAGDLHRLFQNFAQATPSISSRFGGTGLGLALSQKLCALMGGGISVQSELGRGSAFTIRVPSIIEADRSPGVVKDTLASDDLPLRPAA